MVWYLSSLGKVRLLPTLLGIGGRDLRATPHAHRPAKIPGLQGSQYGRNALFLKPFVRTASRHTGPWQQPPDLAPWKRALPAVMKAWLVVAVVVMTAGALAEGLTAPRAPGLVAAGEPTRGPVCIQCGCLRGKKRSRVARVSP
jgi:hypothetical protein